MVDGSACMERERGIYGMTERWIGQRETDRRVDMSARMDEREGLDAWMGSDGSVEMDERERHGWKDGRLDEVNRWADMLMSKE